MKRIIVGGCALRIGKNLNLNSRIQEIARDLYDIGGMAEEVMAFTGLSELEVYRRLCRELSETGWNVRNECQRFGVTPHVFTPEMAEFYRRSNGFIFETLVESQNRDRKNKWFQVIRFLFGVCDSRPEDVTVLLYGDSVGSDSIFLKQLGFKVTYHDYESLCSDFAVLRFRKRNLEITKKSQHKGDEAYDFVLCMEVAEHVPHPDRLVAELKSLMRPSTGYCIFSEAFSLLTDNYPTHLQENIAYAGRTDEMFQAVGLYPVWQDRHRKPVVYGFSKHLYLTADGIRLGLMARLGKKLLASMHGFIQRGHAR